ncbi:MAG: large conductance mechanosensitive channel protein MscL [Coriobacteriia bacterium]|nr:large conductance mechanosensitive channel protein MscL [Coriobacteriia bacterium]
MKIFTEFKKFIAKGNVIELAVAVVMGSAFNAIVSSIVNDLITPLLSVFSGGIDFSTLMISIGSGPDAAQLTYGNLIAAVIHFLIVSCVAFLAIKAYNRFTNKKEEEAKKPLKCKYCDSVITEKAVRCPSCTSILDESAVPEAVR